MCGMFITSPKSASAMSRRGYTAAYVYVTVPSGLPTMFFDQTLN